MRPLSNKFSGDHILTINDLQRQKQYKLVMQHLGGLISDQSSCAVAYHLRLDHLQMTQAMFLAAYGRHESADRRSWIRSRVGLDTNRTQDVIPARDTQAPLWVDGNGPAVGPARDVDHKGCLTLLTGARNLFLCFFSP
jgi:hypothetical protein